ncbi:MAG: endopeptidase La, partial [Acidimicrobiia bacterium]
MTDTQTSLLPLLPLNTGVVLPGMVVTITLESDEARRAAAAAEAAGGRMVLVPRIDGRFSTVGAVTQIESAGELPNGSRALVVRGTGRGRIGSGVPGAEGALHVQVEYLDEPVSERVRDLAREYRVLIESVLEHRGAGRIADVLPGIDEPGALADTAAYSPDLTMEQRVQLLETIDVDARLELAIGWAREVLADLELKDKIRNEVSGDLEKQQREMLLRRQMEAIRKELDDGEEDAVAEYRAKLADLQVTDAVRTAIEKELDRLERMGQQSPEYAWVRNWLDAVFELPWGNYADEHANLGDARAVLDADHEGLDKVKDRILEFLAVRVLRRERGLGSVSGRGSGAILALVGPPGVGKTSLGESVARALGRPFVRVAVGGVRDEAEIRGHRRTYVGSRPGRIVRALTEAGAMNPVLLIDEVDKLQAGGWSGDPASALLEVLDPAQNHTFRDHYLELDLDLSDVLFLTTANVLETIPGPLLDRMEIVQLDGYTEDEKVAIAKHHLFPRQREKAGLRDDELDVTDAAFHAIVAGWTREAGVRSLERQLGTIARKATKGVAEGGATPIIVDEPALTVYLGRVRFRPEDATRAPIPGLATGLAVTGAGGDVLTIEVTGMEGEPGLHVTGQLGEVMSESAHIALSFVRANADELGVAKDAFDKQRFHLHVPAGAVPK